jgi:hypothetical protein
VDSFLGEGTRIGIHSGAGLMKYAFQKGLVK